MSLPVSTAISWIGSTLTAGTVLTAAAMRATAAVYSFSHAVYWVSHASCRSLNSMLLLVGRCDRRLGFHRVLVVFARCRR